MPYFIRTTCGTQFAQSDQPPVSCAICQDERQYVKATGQESPKETWMYVLISRRPNVPRTHAETSALHAVLNSMRKEFDLMPDV